MNKAEIDALPGGPDFGRDPNCGSTAPIFQREERYITIKLSDATKYLLPASVAMLRLMQLKIDEAREQAGLPERVFVVVENDWPEYEPVWQSIKEREAA